MQAAALTLVHPGQRQGLTVEPTEARNIDIKSVKACHFACRHAHQRPRARRLDPLRGCFPGFHQWPLVGIAWEDSKVAKAKDNHCPTSAHQAG
jgi:hypothetical protein